MTGVITTGARMTNIAIVTIDTTIIMTIAIQGRTGSTINATPRQQAGCCFTVRGV